MVLAGEISKAGFLSSVATDRCFRYTTAIEWQSETIGEVSNYPENL